MKRWMFTVLIIFFAGVFLTSAGVLGKYFWDSYIQRRQQDQIVDMVDRPATRPAIAPTAASVPEQTTAPTESAPPTETTAPYEYVTVTDPVTGQTRQIMQEYEELYLLNPHLVGWIQIPGTAVNYPVLQNSAETDYYLYKDIYREYSRHGSIYVRESCDVFAPSDNVTIYGHKMKDGSMFAALNDYEDKAFFEDHRFIYFDTLEQYHTYEVLSVFITTAVKGQGFRYHAFENAADAGEFDSFVETCKALSLYDTGVSAQYGDKLICLSTCNYNIDNGRLVVVAKRITN